MARPDPQLRESLLAHLRHNFPGMCRHWFEDIEPVDVDGGTLSLLVREPIQLRYLQRSCADSFTQAAMAATGRLLAVRFIGEAELAATKRTNDGPVHAEVSEAQAPPLELTSADEMLISPDYSFDNFVVGPANRLAHAAAIAVARKPGKAYNPLFIHGGVGLGKTHLLQAICQEALGHLRDTKIYFTSCDGFMTQFLAAVQAGQMTSFRHRFRGVDILVIDDIHDLSKRNRTQEEFFHTFNSLYQSGRQIVLSSDAPPAEIPDLEERLISRFNCGLVAGIERPDYETRVAILKRKAAMRGITIPDDAASYVAAKIESNIRELEGAITKLQGLSHLDGHKPITLELAKQAVGQHAARTAQRNPTVQEIIDTVINYYGLKLADLLSKRRHKSIALPRQVGMWLARKHTRHSLEEIGGYFGGRDHTTVMHAVRTIDRRRDDDPSIEDDVSRLDSELSGRRSATLEAPPASHR